MALVRSSNVDTTLLAEAVALTPSDRILVFSDDPVLSTALGPLVGSLHVFDQSFSALQRLRAQIDTLGISTVYVSDEVFPAPGSDYDAALMVAPKGRDYGRALLWSAYQALRPGARLYISGANDGGVKSLFDDASELFGNCVTLNIKARHRLASAVRPAIAGAYPAVWGSDPTHMQTRIFDTPQGQFQVATIPGVFSWDHLDDGTRLLLEYVKIAPGQVVLDVGCGNGIIGIVAAHRADYAVLTDDNLLAVRCAREGIRLNALNNASAYAADVYSGMTDKFDLVLSNPPFHKGFDHDSNAALRIIQDAPNVLTPGGKLVIVSNAFLNYERAMQPILAGVRVLARNSRYTVIEGTT